MSQVPENIHTTFDQLLNRADKEQMLQQRSLCVWFTGLSGSGKTTIAKGVERELFKQGFLTQVLDGDNVRSGINNNLGFTEADRLENIRRIAEVTKLFINCGVVTLNCFVSPTQDLRDLAQSIIGADDFIEVYVNAPFSVCEDRDVKGLYKKARAGQIKNFTGLDAPFEAPVNPTLEIKTNELTIEQSVQAVVEMLLPKLQAKP